MNSLWKELLEKIAEFWLTQKAFSEKIGKRSSEINELIKWKRKITIAWDILLSKVFHTPEKYWIYKQIDLDYEEAKKIWEDKDSKNILLNEWDFVQLRENISQHIEGEYSDRGEENVIVNSSHKAGIENDLVKKEGGYEGSKLSIEEDILENTESINIWSQWMEEDIYKEERQLQERKIIDFIEF